MAKLFLSYVREDQERARGVAAALERAGHEVWWDRQIKGGAQYSAEIEAALNAADKIVVLWSTKSVASAWVRDEAAAGRDTGRLVPITLDGTQPPLGFRQFQTIDFSGWKQRVPPTKLQELIDAIGTQSPPSDARVEARPRAIPARTIAVVVALLAVAAAVTGGGWWWWASRASGLPPSVAIEGVDEQSREVARQLTVRLDELQSARGDTFKLISGGQDADLLIQVDSSDSSQKLRRDIAVLAGKDRSILWATSLQQPPSNRDNLSQQLTLTTERVLTCALEALSERDRRIDTVTLKQYLSGCSRWESQYGLGQYDPGLDNLFEQVVAKAPHFEGAWAKLLALESETVKDPDAPQVLVNRLKRHIAQAEKLGIDIGEVYVAKSALLPNSDFAGIFQLYDQGIIANPNDPYLYRMRSEKLQAVGRMNDSVADAGQALELDPLSPALMDNYISALAYSGQVDAAYIQLRKAEAMWPAAENLLYARYRLDLRFGDAKEALALYRGSSVGHGDRGQQAFIEARLDPTAQNIQTAIDAERMTNRQEPRYIAGLMQALGQFGRNDEAIDVLLNYGRLDALGFNAEVLFRPALQGVWRDPRSIAAAVHVGLLGFWKASGKWPDFCADPKLPYDCRKEAAKYRV